jgi:uncharacterized membrane protein YphA (DoxX/SURF4 family)
MTGDLFVWVGLTVLAIVFAVLGPMKLNYEQFCRRKGCGWASDLPKRQVQLIGILETLAAVALVWPLATQTFSWLSPLAAICLAVLMGLAAWFHTKRRETELAGLCVLLGVLAAVVAYGILF